MIGNVFSHVLTISLKFPSSHVFAHDQLPDPWQIEILRLFDISESFQAPDDTDSSGAHEETWSPIELRVRQTLAKFAEISKDQIERLSPIYRYGLDSITAIQLASLLRERNMQVSAVDVLAHPTCAGIAAAIQNGVEGESYKSYNFTHFQEHVRGEVKTYEIDPKTIETVLPCTSTQQGLLSQFLNSGGRYYFNYSSWALDNVTSPEAIARAWSRLTSHHQILRTGFIPVDHPDSSFSMLVYGKNAFTAPVTIHEPGAFNSQLWFSDASARALETLAIPPWQVALEKSETVGGEVSLTIHLALHHALYDAFTLRSLINDLSEILSYNREPKPTDISSALSHYLGQVKSSQAAGDEFWKQKAADFVSTKFPIMTPLKIDSSDILIVSRTCETYSSRFRKASSQAGITMQAALQTALIRLLSAYVGESRVTFGVVLDGRTTDITQKTTLPMITTLPVLADNTLSDTDLIQQMMKYNAELRRFQFTPTARIQRLLNTTSTLFDAIMIYQAADTNMGSPPFRLIEERASVEYPISLEIEETSTNQTKLNLGIRASILPREQAILLLGQFEAILMDLLFPAQNPTPRPVVANPGLFSILPPTYESLPADAYLLHELLEVSAQSAPTAVALEFVSEVTDLSNRQRWTYQEIDALGNQIAHFITSHGASPGRIIATCFNKCPVAYFTLLGILKAGCAFLCLDPSAPASRQVFILDDSNAAMLILCDQFDWASEASLPVHMVNEEMLKSFPISRPSLNRQVLPSDSCYCLYTSGTTGTPKGCLISHENAVQAMAAFKHLFTGRWNSASRWLQFAAFHFDVSILEQYWSWYVGITVVAAPKDVILSDLALTISELGITHIDLTPSLARLITPEECPSLCEGVFITGGEKLRSEILDAWGSQRVIHNAYGPTEATIGVTMYCGVPQNGRPSNIGNLFPNVGAYVFEPGSEIPVIRGGVGELCVSGKLVGQGYLNREALTRERFPVLKASGERIYRTGDLVRILHDDSIDFVGRADDQVKLRGQRLEIGEINHAIREGMSGKAGDVTTMVIQRTSQDTDVLVSFIASSSNSNASVKVQVAYDADHRELARTAQEACRSRLATYMVPSFVICLSRMPLSSNNKVDVNRLKALFSELSHEQLQSLSTRSSRTSRGLNRLESKILEAICRVTRAEEYEVSPITTIFELGIDSITATRLARHLRAIGFASATPSLILRHPQIEQLCTALNKASFESPDSGALQVKQSIEAFRQRYIGLACQTLDIDSSEVEYIAPCTPLQQGMIVRSKVRESQLAYFNQFRLRLNPDVSIERLKAGFGRLTASYSILRSAFVSTPDGFLQVAIKNRSMRWFKVESDADSLDQTISERHGRWIEANRNILRWPVEIDHITDDGQNYLFLRLFHAVYDAHSLNLLLESLEAEYKGANRPVGPTFISVLPEGPLLSHQKSHAFWKILLKDHRFQPMPSLVDKPNSASSLIRRSIQFQGLEDIRRKLQVTHQTLLQAAWLHTLRRYFAEPPTIGVILSGRSLPIDDIDLVVGPLFNTLPLRADIANDMSWASIAQEIQNHNNNILSFVHTPLRDIQKLCDNGQALFDTLFTFNRDYESTSASRSALWSIEDTPSHPDYPLAVEIMMAEDETLVITLAAQGRIADNSALGSLLDEFTASLKSLITSADEAPFSQAPRKEQPETKGHISRHVRRTTSSSSDITPEPHESLVSGDEVGDVRREIATLARIDEEEISSATNLFALGLDSIDMIKLSGRLTRLGYNVAVGALMKHPTLESIISGLKTALPPLAGRPNTITSDNEISIAEKWYRQAGFVFSDVEAVLPPTPIQDSMVAEMLRSDFQTYFNHDILELPPDTDIDRLKASLSTIYEKSPVLRTGFIEVDDPSINSAYCQLIRRRELKFIPTLSISSMDGLSRLVNKAILRAKENKGASDLFQASFAELGTRKLMVLSIAHALYDGWSLNMLHKDIRAAYENSYTPRKSYKLYLLSMLLRSRFPTRKFWADFLQGAPVTPVPKSGITTEHSSIRRLHKQSKRSVADIKVICKTFRVTPQVLGQACWASVLASLAKSPDVVFGTVLSGRDTEEAEELMFPTMNTVPLRLTLHGTVTEFLEYAQDIMSSVLEFQHTPLREIQKSVRGRGDQLFNTIFLLQRSVDNDSGDDSFFRSIQSFSAVDYPLCVELELTAEDAVWHVALDTNAISPHVSEKIGVGLEKVLDYFVQDANEPVLRFNSHDPTMVSICGLEPVTISPQSQEQPSALPKSKRASQEILLSSRTYEVLRDVLSELCQIDQHEINSELSVFHIGLDSISAIKASSMLRKRGLQISTRDLVTIRSIRGIVEHVDRKMNENTERLADKSLQIDSIVDGKEIEALIQRSGLNIDAIEVILPALPVQVHMLSVWQNSGGATFFPKFSFKMSGITGLDTISKACDTLVDEIAMLRTHLITTTSLNPAFLQIILKPEAARKSARRVVNESDGQWNFVFLITPFALIQLHRDRIGEVYLNLHIHHALYDGISLPTILDRFARLCSNTPPVAISSYSASWHDFSLQHYASPVQVQRESFWVSYLKKNGAAYVSQIHQPSETTHGEQVSEFCRAPIMNIEGLRLRRSAHGISTQALLLAVYAKAIMKWLHRDTPTAGDVDYIFGIYLANRSGYPALEDAPFPTLNILPLRVKSALKRDITTIAADIQQDIASISTFENSTASLGEIERWTGISINTFVNILPDHDDTLLPEANDVTLTKAPDDKFSIAEGLDVSDHLIGPNNISLTPNAVLHSYPVSNRL